MIKGKNFSTGQVDGAQYVEIPEGWKRILENDLIHYISPSSCCLKSYENVIEYLKTDGTCKCGLDCPFFVHHVFNFDSSVQNKEKKDDSQEAGTKTTSCKLCDSNRLKGSYSANDQIIASSPLNQTLKQVARKTAKQSTYDGPLTSKKVTGHSRTKLDSPKVKRSKKASSPLSDIPSPPPIPKSSPVQNVPNNLGANQGPLPSFASIVSSSKFFNPGPHRGPLYPTGSLPLKTNEQNAFAFPKPVSNMVTSSSISVITTSSATITSQAETNHSYLECLSPKNRVPEVTKSTQSSRVLSVTGSINSAFLMTSFTTVPSMPNVSASFSTGTTSTVASIINTPTLPSLFSPLDGAAVTSNEPKKLPIRPTPKSKPRARQSRAKPKPKLDQKSGGKLKPSKINLNVSNAISSVQSAFATSSAAVTTHTSKPLASHWPVPVSSVLSNTGQVSYQTSSYNPVNTSVLYSSKNLSSTSTISSCVSGNLPVTKQPMGQQVLTHQVTMPSSIYMSQSYQSPGIRPQSFVSSGIGESNHPTQNSLAQTSGGAMDGKSSTVNLSQAIAAASLNYSVVATPRIQAQPGMMYVAATPGVNVFPSSYPYVAASTQQIPISQGSFTQTQNKSSLSVTTSVSTGQQAITGSQTVSSDSGANHNQGKVSFQVPGMFVQGATPNQMFPINPQSFNMGQYKGTYQLPSAMYQTPMQGSTMALIAPNGAKGTYPGVQAVAAGNIGQFTYQNPYMFGIVMPSSTTQPSSVSVSTTKSLPAMSTCVTTSLQMIQPQNPAVAAAFESFVPIAPAAGGQAPRFAQTLAHLASAYNTFQSPGILQSPNASQIQLAYQMMQMNATPNTAHAPQMGSMAGLITPEIPLKHTITPSVKQGPLTSTATVTATTKGVMHVPSKPQTSTQSAPSTITTMSQSTRDYSTGMRSPYSTTTTSSSLSASSPPCTSVFSVQTSVVTKNAQPHYSITIDQFDPAMYNHKTLQSPTCSQISPTITSSPAPRICNSPKTPYYGTTTGAVSGMTTTSHESQEMACHYETSSYTTNESSMSSTFTKSNGRTNATIVNTDHNEPSKGAQNPLGYSSFPTDHPPKMSVVLPNDTDSSTVESSFEVKPQSCQATKGESNSISPLRTSAFPVSSEHKMNFSIENTGSSISKPCTISSVLSPVEVPSMITSTVRECTSIISDSTSGARTIGSNDIPVKNTKYELDDVNYYATNPLLGMKRSCEAIEVYPDPPENTDCNEDDDDDDDDERDDYCSSNEDITERDTICDDPPMEAVRDLRQHGESQHVEDPFHITNQVRNPTKEMYNGGCNEVHDEQEMKNEHLGVNIKPNPQFAPPSFRTEMFGELSIPHVRPHFDIGDVVWAQARGLPSWPGQIVDESKVGKGRADDGKKWVMWFGDHTFSQVEVDRLKTLSEGLRTLDDKTRKKKYRAKKARISMEQAISEALEELEVRERLKTKPGMRSKAKKKRLR